MIYARGDVLERKRLQEKNQFNQFEKLNKQYYKYTTSYVIYDATLYSLIDSINSILIALIIWYGWGQYHTNLLSLGLLVAFQFGATWQCAALLIFSYFLVALTLIDMDEYLLPDSLTLPLMWVGLFANSFSVFTSLESAIYGAMAGYLSLWSIYWLFKIVTGKEGMGYGDFKLLAAIGAFLGWQALPVVILLSSVVGAVVGVLGIVILGRDKNIAIPFGPYLAAAGFIAALWGNDITAAYFQFAGIR